MGDRRSYSQLSSYQRCPEAYRLERIERVKPRPAAWLGHGTAVHAAVELYEKNLQTNTKAELYQEAVNVYVKEINELLDETPDLSEWFNSGPYEGAADIERRYNLLSRHVDNYLEYAAKPSTKPIYIDKDGVPAVEMPFDVEIGGVRVTGRIDQVRDTGLEFIEPEDVKSGAEPGGIEQLTTYAVALEQTTDKQVIGGSFLMTKSGKPYRSEITAEHKERIAVDFSVMDAAVNRGDFPAKPEKKMCERCPVAQFCKFKEI